MTQRHTELFILLENSIATAALGSVPSLSWRYFGGGTLLGGTDVSIQGRLLCEPQNVQHVVALQSLNR